MKCILSRGIDSCIWVSDEMRGVGRGEAVLSECIATIGGESNGCNEGGYP